MKIQAVPEFMFGLVTRGSQDAYTGYGNDWSVLRKAPNEWAASCLAAKDKPYFNFEHEESAGHYAKGSLIIFCHHTNGVMTREA